MARAVADIERDIRQLTERDREQLLRSLIDQLDGPADTGPFDTDVDQAWLTESQRRLTEIEQGKAKTVPGPQVLEEARKLIKSLKR
jgi:putative addiction module component (TIGR02574 family)